MAWTHVVKYVRESTDTKWAWEDGTADLDSSARTTYATWQKENYEDNGKYISINRSLSGDNLTATVTRVFDSEASKNAFMQESNYTTWRDKKTSYNEDNNITMIFVSSEET